MTAENTVTQAILSTLYVSMANRAMRARKPATRDCPLVSLHTECDCLLVEVPVLVGLHLTEPQHSILALSAVVVGLLPIVGAALRVAVLGGGVLLEPSRHDAVQLLMLPPVSYHLISIRAIIVTLQTMEM